MNMPAKTCGSMGIRPLVLLILFTAGCDPSFDPLQENDRYFFSIYGYLDASADTQWVRVAPVRDSLNVIPEEVDATVTLEHLDSGDTVVMNDSLFDFFHGVRAHNFWTTMDIQPEGTYRLRVERSDGVSSEVTVTLPADFPAPRVQISDRRIDDPDVVLIEGVAQLADVQTMYYMQSGTVVSLPHLQDTVRTSPTAYQVFIDPDEDRQHIDEFFGGAELVIDAQIFVAAAGPGWPPFASIDEKVIALPQGISNVENGVGYLGGVLSKAVPYKICFDGSGNLIDCPVEE